MITLNESETIRRAEKQLLLQEIAKNSLLIEQIKRFKQLIVDRAARAKADELAHKENEDEEMMVFCQGKYLEGIILLDEFPRL